MTRTIPFALAALLASAPLRAADPEQEAHVELGIGGAFLYLPDYRGATHYDTWLVPFPYFVYRSPQVQVTREGLRARLFNAYGLSLTVSGAGAVPGTDSAAARAGMPKLLPTFEIGPSLDLQLYTSEDRKFQVKARAPIRAVIATDLGHWEGAGWVFEPHVRFDKVIEANGWQTVTRLALGPQWATDRYHDYYYTVSSQYQTPQRPAYDASGGYSGTGTTLSSYVAYGKWHFGGFVSYVWMRGVVFDRSPLFQTESAMWGGCFVTYRLYSRGPDLPEHTDNP